MRLHVLKKTMGQHMRMKLTVNNCKESTAKQRVKVVHSDIL